MSFAYGERVRQYIDASQATPTDRIKVVLESGESVALMLSQHGPYASELLVDRERTDQAIIDLLGEHAHERLLNGYSWDGPLKHLLRWRHQRSVPPVETIRQQMRLEVWVRHDGDSMDHSPRVGERLVIVPTIAGYGGSGWASANLITEVTFVSV